MTSEPMQWRRAPVGPMVARWVVGFWLLTGATSALAVIAGDDAYTTNEDVQLVVSAPGVLGDDDLQGGSAASVDTNTVPSNGTVTVNADGSFTYMPGADFNGTDSFEYTASNDQGTDTAIVTITVDAVNDAPSFTGGGDFTVNEDSGSQTVTAWATSILAGPADEAGQALTFSIDGNTNPGLFSTPPAIDGTTGDLTFTPAAEAEGSADITVTLSDNGGTADGGDDTSPAQTFTITVSAVNDAPTFTAGPDQMLPEDSSAQTVAGWASGLSPGPANESDQTLTFNIVSNSNTGLFSVQPAVDGSSGDLTYTPAPDANGSATIELEVQDSGGTANGGVDTSPPQTFTISLTPVNDEPSFTSGGDVTVNEDAGAHTVPAWAGSIFEGAVNEDGQTLTFNVNGNTNPGLFSTPPAVDSTTGDLTFTPAADAVGSADITLTLSDDGGTADGGDDTSPAQTFTITVSAVNDAPSFTAGPDQTVQEDAGPQAVANWATGMSPGPSDESAQTLTFNVASNSNAGLFSTQPAVDAGSGDLTYTPADNANGSATIAIELQDGGGTANGGEDTSPTQSFTISVGAQNDDPFVANPIADVATFEDAPDIVIDLSAVFDDVDIATNGDSLTLAPAGNSNPDLFDSVTISGETLTLDLAFDQNGSATLEITATDSAGAPVADSFNVTVSGVNDTPAAADDSATMAEDSGFIDVPVMCNDYLAETPTGITVAGVGGFSESEPTTILDRNEDAITEPNAQVSIIEDGVTCPDGTITDAVRYQPKANFHGEDFFNYTIADAQGDTSTATVTVTVTPVNDPPEGLQQRDFVMEENQVLTVTADSGLLAGTYDVDGALLDENGVPVGETLTVDDVVFPSVGSLTLDNTTGTFEYQPPVDFTGDVEFQYRLFDGTDLSTGEAYRVRIAVLEVAPPPEPPPAGEVATIFNLANAPLEQSTGVPPNVVVVMDDSGSMDWNLVVGEAGHDGTFTLDNRDVASGNRRRSTNYTYLWDLSNNAYPPTSGNGRILPTQQALEADPDTDGSNYGVWRARTHLYNPVYYNPAIEYTPWVGQDAVNNEFSDADPNAIRLNPRDPSQTFDLLAPHTYRSTRVPEWHGSGGSKTVWVNDLYLPRYYDATPDSLLNLSDPPDLIEIRDGDGPLPGGEFPGGPGREDCALDDGDPTTCTYAQEIQNFANYFQYYRTREYVTKNGMGKVISQLQDIRIGYMTISATTREDIREMNALHTEGNKKALLDNVYRVDSYGGTPLRQALGRAGDVFAGSFGGLEDPMLPAPEGFCQQNFALLFSDGYWNGGTGTTGNPDGDDDSAFDGGRYADSQNATLADVAMQYYENDLRPELDNEVPVMRRDTDGVPDGVFPEVDARMHQHMKTYTVAFGVVGTVDPADVPLDPTTPFDWPNPFSGNQEKIDDMLHTAINGRGRFLNAGNPQELQAAFESAFLEFTQAASSTSSAAFNSTSLREGTLLYRGFYDLRDNTGELTATIVNDDGTLAPAPEWRASERLNPGFKQPDNRVIASFDPVAGTGIPFRHALLTPEQQLTLNEDQVNYLRGNRDAETPNGPLRERPVSDGLLGDIVNSSPVFVGAPRAINRDQRPFPVDDLYSEFVDSVETRSPVVYVGANDGMLHGFDALTGDEVFAYVPNKIIDSSQGHHNPLDLFTSPFYQHRYYVDLTPRLNDVYMRGSRTAVGKSWNTVLVGGLGVGGKGFFSLNVGQPDSTFTSENNAAAAVLWEFTDEDDTYPVDGSGNPLGGAVGAITDPSGQPVKDLGYTVSLPVVGMTNVGDGGSPENREWAAIFGNGPNSTAGIAKLFVLFMDRGLNGWQEGDFVKLDTGFGVQSPPHPMAGYPNALGTPAAVDTDLNGTVDRVYAGDRLGNLFRFDISDANPDNWTVTRLFTASYTDPDTGEETIQPILNEPTVIKHPTERGFLVMFGTGSHLTRDDVDSEDIQSIYGIWDEGSSSPVTALDNTKAERLVEQTITNVMDSTFDPPTVRRIVSDNPVNYQQDEGGTPGTYGWFIDLDMERADGDSSGRTPPEPQFPGEKAIRRLLFRDGTIITTTVLPSLDEFSCFGSRPGSILLFDAVTGGDAGRPVVDFNTDGVIDGADLVAVGEDEFAGGILFNQEDLDGQLVDLSTLGGEGDTDFLFVSGGNETISYRIEDVNDNRTGRLSWRELESGN